MSEPTDKFTGGVVVGFIFAVAVVLIGIWIANGDAKCIEVRRAHAAFGEPEAMKHLVALGICSEK